MSNFSIGRLANELSIEPDDAAKLRELLHFHGHKGVDKALEFANKAMEAHGIEAIRDYRVWDNYYGEIVALYVNVGDAYATTVIYDVERDTYLIQGYGDWVERFERRKGRRLP